MVITVINIIITRLKKALTDFLLIIILITALPSASMTGKQLLFLIIRHTKLLKTTVGSRV